MQYLIPGWKFDPKKPCLVRGDRMKIYIPEPIAEAGEKYLEFQG